MSSEWFVKQNDTTGTIKAQLVGEDDAPVSLLTATAVEFHMRLPGTNTPKIDSPAVIIDAPTGKVGYTWQAGDTDTVGLFYAEWQVTFEDGGVQTFPNWTNDTVKVTREQA